MLTPSSSPHSTAVAKPNNHDQTVAIASALPLGLMLLGLIVWLLRRRFTTRRVQEEPSGGTCLVTDISALAETMPATQLQAHKPTMQPSLLGLVTNKGRDVSKPIDFGESPAHEDLPQPTAGSSRVNDLDVDRLDGDSPDVAVSSNLRYL